MNGYLSKNHWFNYKAEEGNEAKLIHAVCDYFDTLKNTKISAAQLSFLLDFSNIVGIPQYIDLLKNNYFFSLPDNEIKTLSNISSEINRVSLTAEKGIV